MRHTSWNVDSWVCVEPTSLQRVVRRIIARPGRWLLRYRAFNVGTVPLEGGCIIAPNHGSKIDPFVFSFGTKRSIRFMSKYQALEWPFIGWVIAYGGGFPVRRGQDGQPALTIAQRILAAGGVLMMFMEGKMVRHQEPVGDPKRGLAVLALQTGCAVVPTAAYGNKPSHAFGRKRRFWRRRQVTVIWGAPLHFEKVEEPTPERVDEARDQIWDAVMDLYDTAKRIDALRSARDEEGISQLTVGFA